MRCSADEFSRRCTITRRVASKAIPQIWKATPAGLKSTSTQDAIRMPRTMMETLHRVLKLGVPWASAQVASSTKTGVVACNPQLFFPVPQLPDC